MGCFGVFNKAKEKGITPKKIKKETKFLPYTHKINNDIIYIIIIV